MEAQGQKHGEAKALTNILGVRAFPGLVELPRTSGVRLDNGADAVTEASTAELLHWLRRFGVSDARLKEVEQLDRALSGFRRAVLRYGLVKAQIEKGHSLPIESAHWRAFEAAMRERLGDQ
jgi:hypothetical protein